MKLEEILPEIRKGRKFRLKGWFTWAHIKKTRFDSVPIALLESEDWELEPKKVEVTREQLAEAWQEAGTLHGFTNIACRDHQAFAYFVKKLGFE